MAARLLFVVSHAAFFLSHRLPIALAARSAGFEVHVAAPRDEAALRIEALGLPSHEVAFTRASLSVRAELDTVARLARLYRRLRPDVVHHVSPMPVLYGGLAARITRVPAVVHAVSGMGYVFTREEPRIRAMRRGVLLGYKVAAAHPNSAFIFQNEDDEQKIGRTRARLVSLMRGGSGVDLERFRPTPLPSDDPPIVLLPARLAWDKGVGEFVLAARRLASRGVRARFVLAGASARENPEKVSEDQLRAWVDEGVVEWWGHRTDMPEVFARSTLVCHPSYREGMPKSLMEACAVGRPFVTTNVPGNRDVKGRSGAGVLVPVKDAMALEEAIGELLGDRSRLERMAAEAAARARDFDVREVVAQTLEIYRRLLDR